jgi:hypothetical protein
MHTRRHPRLTVRVGQGRGRLLARGRVCASAVPIRLGRQSRPDSIKTTSTNKTMPRPPLGK